MIILHRKPDDPFAAEVERVLKDLVVAYKTREYDEGASKETTPEYELPFIQENGTLVTGRERIKKYLDELSEELRQQRMVTGDGCYIDPETGKICSG